MFSTLCRVLTLIAQQIDHKSFKRGFQVNMLLIWITVMFFWGVRFKRGGHLIQG